MYGQSVSANTEVLTVEAPVGSLDELNAALPKLAALRSIRLTLPLSFSAEGAALAASLDAFRLEHPSIEVAAMWQLDGADPEKVAAYVAKPEDDVGKAGLIRMLTALPNLEFLDLTAAAPAREAIASAVAASPQVQILWEDPAFGASDSGEQMLSFAEEVLPDALAAYLSCFPSLREVDLYDTDLSEPDADAICAAFPAVQFHRMVTLNGVACDSFEELLNFDGVVIENYDAFSDALAAFPRLQRIELNDCSLTDEQLAALAARYPKVKVVWTVHFRKFALRTDAVAFSTQQPGDNDNRLTSRDVDPLRYCTDLIALDLGHNDLDDLDFLRPLTKLQVLILADSRKLKDISVLGTLHNLKYVELFLTGVSDISPLSELHELLDVNLCITHVADPTPLLACKKLERIWIGQQTLQYMNEEGLHTLMEAFPNAQYDLTSVSCTNLGWREHPRFFAFRSMFKTGEPVEPFLP